MHLTIDARLHNHCAAASAFLKGLWFNMHKVTTKAMKKTSSTIDPKTQKTGKNAHYKPPSVLVNAAKCLK